MMRQQFHSPYFKFCKRCGIRFQPCGRFYKYCDPCKLKERKKFLKRVYGK